MDALSVLTPFFASLPRGGVIAVDGRCAAGKTTLASLLEKKLGARTVHMDDFFLPEALRTPERLDTPGGNVHYERFLSEVAPFLREGAFSYMAFDCRSGGFAEKRLPAAPYTVVEGSYCLHPSLIHLYDLKIFLDLPPALQRERILSREGARAQTFFDKWIPLEEKYFDAYGVRAACDTVIKEY